MGPNSGEGTPPTGVALGIAGWLVGMFLAALYLVGARSGNWFAGDEAKYVGLALSLSEGAGYVTNGVEHAVYPPGYPLALVPAVRLVGLDPPGLTLYSVVISLISLGALWFYFRQRGDVARPWIYPLLMLGSVGVFQVFTDLRSEGVFILALALMLAVFEMLAPEKGGPGGSGRRGRVVLVGLCALGGAFVPAVRAAGIALPAALVATVAVGWLRRRLPGRSWTAAAVAAFVGGVVYQTWWWRREVQFGSERSYLRLLSMVDPHQPDMGTAGPGQVLVRLLDQAGLQLSKGLELLTNVSGIERSLTGPLQVLLACILALGLMRELRRPNPLAGWFFLAYAGVVVLWPFNEGTRFLVPVLPLMFLFAGQGVLAAWDTWPQTALGWRRLGVVCVIGAAATTGESLLREMPSRQGLLWLGLWSVSAFAAFGLSRRLPRRPSLTPMAFVPAWIAFFVLLGAPVLIDSARRQHAGEEKFEAARIGDAAIWVSQETDSGHRISSTAEAQALFLHTGRFTTELPATADTLVLWSLLDDGGSRYLVVPVDHEYPYLSPTGDARLRILDRARPGRLRLVHTYPLGRIFEVRPP